MRSREEYERYRRQVVYDPTESVELSLIPPCFVCKACYNPLKFIGLDKGFVCNLCTFDLSIPEAAILLDLGKLALEKLEALITPKELIVAPKRRSFWHWLRSLLK